MPYLKTPTEKVSVKTKVAGYQHIDGAVSVASYIVNEIKTNTKGEIAGSIRNTHSTRYLGYIDASIMTESKLKHVCFAK